MSDSPEELLSRVAAMKKQLKNFRILGADGVTIHGSMQHGYAVDTGGGGGGGGGGGATGACCVGTTCIVASAADCSAAAGIYQGDATPCSPNPCVTGACCFIDPSTGLGFCDVLSEADCTGTGGGYGGDGITCAEAECQCDNRNLPDINTITLSGTLLITAFEAPSGGSLGCDLNLPEITVTKTWNRVDYAFDHVGPGEGEFQYYREANCIVFIDPQEFHAPFTLDLHDPSSVICNRTSTDPDLADVLSNGDSAGVTALIGLTDLTLSTGWFMSCVFMSISTNTEDASSACGSEDALLDTQPFSIPSPAGTYTYSGSVDGTGYHAEVTITFTIS